MNLTEKKEQEINTKIRVKRNKKYKYYPQQIKLAVKKSTVKNYTARPGFIGEFWGTHKSSPTLTPLEPYAPKGFALPIFRPITKRGDFGGEKNLGKNAGANEAHPNSHSTPALAENDQSNSIARNLFQRWFAVRPLFWDVPRAPINYNPTLFESPEQRDLSDGIRKTHKGLNCTMGFDTEWFVPKRSSLTGVLKDAQAFYGDSTLRYILSYQFCFTYQGHFYEFCFMPQYNADLNPEHQRLRLDYMYYYILDFMGFVECDYTESHLYLVGHFAGVDVSALRNWQGIFKKRSEHDKVILQNKQVLYTGSPMRVNAYSKFNNHKHKLMLDVRDTMGISSPKTTLDSLGSALGVPKLSTEKLDEQEGKPLNHYKMNMDELYRDHHDFFIDYALMDARISYIWYMEFCKKFGDSLTVSQASARKVREIVSNKVKNALSDKAYQNLLVEIQQCASLKDTTAAQRYVYDYLIRGFYGDKDNFAAFKNSNHKPWYGEIASKCYYGGHNECYTHGIHHVKTFDIDIKQAYMIALLSMHDVDFKQAPDIFDNGHVLSLSDIPDPTRFGFGYIEFEFPKHTYAPNIPVRSSKKDGASPVFPLEGKTYACTPDVYAGLKQGARVKVLGNGFIMPQMADTRFLAETIEEMMQQREEDKQKYGKGSAFELLDKIVNNGFYGKTGQGVKGKKERDFLTGEREEVEYCQVSDPCLASMITGIVRMLLSMITQSILESGYEVYSSTTDGLITNMPKAKHHKIDDFIKGSCDIFHKQLKRVLGIGSLVEIKHVNDYFANVSTRTNFGVTDEPGFDGVLAKGSFKGDDHFRRLTTREQAEYMISLFLKRRGRIPDVSNSLNNLFELKEKRAKDIEELEVDEQGNIIQKQRRLSMDFDMKRKPVCKVGNEIKNGLYSYGYFETKPYANMEEYEQQRAVWKLVKKREHTIKTDTDLAMFKYQVQHLEMPNYKPTYTKDKKDRIKMRSLVGACVQGLYTANDMQWLRSEFNTWAEFKTALNNTFDLNIKLDSIFKKASSDKVIDIFMAQSLLRRFVDDYKNNRHNQTLSE